MKFKDFVDSQVKLWFLNDKGDISKTKIGIAAAAISGGIVSLPATAAAFGVALVLPPAVVAIAKYTGIIGLAFAGVKGKDSVDASKPKAEQPVKVEKK